MTKTVLIGTTNPAKINRFRWLLADYDVQLITLRDLNIVAEPRETGRTPAENARQKAEFYGRFSDLVLCNDSGLYFVDLPLEDPRQPGLHIRSPQGIRLNDDEMIAYYSGLAHSMGGKALAAYYDGVAVYNNGIVTDWMDKPEFVRQNAFALVEVPSPKRHPGWPLDSLSVNCGSGRYFVEGGSEKDDEQIILGEYRRHLIDFLVKALGLTAQ